MHFRTVPRLLASLAMAACTAVLAQEGAHASAPSAARMREAAARFLAAVPEGTRAKAVRPFDDRDRVDWHYTPRSRNGVALRELDAKGSEAAHALLREALSAGGYQRVVNIIELELVLREIETFGLLRDPGKYHLTIYGAPDRTKAWGWRFEGHHLSLNFTLAGDRMAVDSPSILGANPAAVAAGPRKGLRTLAPEEDDARRLLASLDEAQRREAVFDTRTYGDIVTGAAANALDGAVAPEVKRERFERLMEVAQAVSAAQLAKKVGRTIDVLVDDVQPENDRAIARSKGDAPDIDGQVIIEGAAGISPGDIVSVVVTASDEYDLFAVPAATGEDRPALAGVALD